MPKITYDIRDAVPEHLRDGAEELGEGAGFTVTVDSIEDDVYKPQTAGMRSALEKLKTADKDQREKLRAYEGIDPEEYQKLKEAQDEAARQLAEKDGDVESLVDQRTKKIREEAEAKQKATDTQLGDLTSLLNKLVVENELTAAALSAGVQKGAVQTAVLLARASVKRDGDNAVVYEADGTTERFGSDGERMKPAEFLVELVKDHPYLLEKSSGAGGDNSSGSGGAGSNGQPPGNPLAWNEKQKMDYIKEHGGTAYAEMISKFKTPSPTPQT